MTQVKYSPLDAERLAKLKSFEKELGSWVLAVEPAAELANLSDEQVDRLRTLEEELGVILLAYSPATG